MDNTRQTNVTIVVEDEKALYSTFSPEVEFNESVKAYIKAKIAEQDYNKNISMTVRAHKPLDEEKFRTAVANWIRSEQTLGRMKEKNTIRPLIGLLLFGSVLLWVSIVLVERNDVLKYSLLPIMGSLALSSATKILIIDIPTIHAEKVMTRKTQKNSTVTFVYDNDQ